MTLSSAPDSKLVILDDGIIVPPSNLWSDEPPLESDWHREQIELLLACLKWYWSQGQTVRTDFYASGNLTIYFSPELIKSRDFRGPDFFVVLGVDPHPRKSWVVWAEQGKYPNVIVEMLSDSTAAIDRNFKKQLYQDTFRTPEYFWFHPETLEFQGFSLISGQYQSIDPTAQGWFLSQQLGLYLGIHNNQLRFFTPEHKLVPTPLEQLQQAEQQTEKAEAKAQRLAERLRAMGVNPDELA